jgi:hypothetical protein
MFVDDLGLRPGIARSDKTKLFVSSDVVGWQRMGPGLAHGESGAVKAD